jgi:hypothetical protein
LLTNPKHTSSDLVEWCSQDLPCARYQALEAENERLREALELADASLRGANMNMNVVERKVRAALKESTHD